MSTGDFKCKHGLWVDNCQVCNMPEEEMGLELTTLRSEVSTLKAEVDGWKGKAFQSVEEGTKSALLAMEAVKQRDLARKELQEAREAVKMACEETGDCHEGTLEMVIPFWRQNVCPHCSLFKPTPSPAGEKGVEP